MSEEFKDFIRKCTVMDPEQRMSTTQLLSVRLGTPSAHDREAEPLTSSSSSW